MAAGVAAAVVGAGLIAVTPITPPTPAAPPPVQHIDVQLTTDVLTAVSDNIQNGFSDLGGALVALIHLHLSQSLQDVFTSGLNAVFVPENLAIGLLDAVAGQSAAFFTSGLPIFVGPDVIGTVWNLLQETVTSISKGVTQLFSLDVSDAFVDFSQAFNRAVVEVPAELLAGPLMALGL